MSKPKIKIDTSEFNELLLEVLFQACGVEDGKIDNQCISVYEDACDYLIEQGYLYTQDGRIYEVKIKQ